MRPRTSNPSAVLQRRRAAAASSSSTAATSVKEDESENFPSYAYAFPTPEVDADGAFVFETLILMYSMTAMALQWLHLYRSVFWLPHSYNSHAVNWYLVEWRLAAFVGLFLGRRLLWNSLKAMIGLAVPASLTQSFIIVGRSLTSLTILVSLFGVIYATLADYSVLSLLCLVYPAAVYFALFGFAGEPYLELAPNTSNGKMRLFKDKSGAFRTSYSMMAQNPETVRLEAGLLRQDFNARLKQVAFNSFCNAYYATIAPLAFAQSTLHYEMVLVLSHALFVWLGAFSLYASFCFPAPYVHFLHRCAASLGSWRKIDASRRVDTSTTLYTTWQSGSFWPKDVVVRHGKDLYRALGVVNAAEPGNVGHARFHALFCDLSLASRWALLAQSALVLAQHLALLSWSTRWYSALSAALMLFANYYALFKALRDFFAFRRIRELFL